MTETEVYREAAEILSADAVFLDELDKITWVTSDIYRDFLKNGKKARMTYAEALKAVDRWIAPAMRDGARRDLAVVKLARDALRKHGAPLDELPYEAYFRVVM